MVPRNTSTWNIMKKNYRNIAYITIRILLGVLFLLSGIGKLIDGSDARYLVELLATEFYWLIEYAQPIVIAISLAELALAALLLWGRYLKTTFIASFVMLAGFSSVLGYFYLQGMSVENCGCFGAFGFGSSLEFTLVRNGILMVLVVAALAMGRTLRTRHTP